MGRSLGSLTRNGHDNTRMGRVAQRARRSKAWARAPGGTKRTPYWASTMPARDRRRRLPSVVAIGPRGRPAVPKRRSPEGTLPESVIRSREAPLCWLPGVRGRREGPARGANARGQREGPTRGANARGLSDRREAPLVNARG